MTDKKRIIITILCVIGLLLSFDLVYIYIKTNFMTNAPQSFCSINGFVDCDGVAKTTKAFFLGVPLAIWGVILYLLFLFLTWVDKIREKINFPLLNVFKNPLSYIATIGLISFLISISLASVSLFQIKKICILCFATYFINLFIATCAVGKDFFVSDIKNTVADFLDGAKNYFILFLVVCLSAVSILFYLQKSLILAPNIKKFKAIKVYQEMKTNPYKIEGSTLGNPDGDVKIYVYGDFMCPSCRAMNVMLHKLAQEDKNIVIYHNNFPLDSFCNPSVKYKIHPGACILSRYALAAENQGNYWGMVNLIYDNLPKDEIKLLELAKMSGFDVDKLKKDAYSNETIELLDGQIQRGNMEHIVATPTIIIDGIPHSDLPPYYQLKELIKQSRNRHGRAK